MLCPLDKSALQTHEEGATRILFCEICQGFWFNREQLAGFLQNANSPKIPRQKKTLTAKVQYSADQRGCPTCEKTNLSSKLIDGGEIDICPKCHGIWLDAGELELIITRYHRKQKLGLVSDIGSEFINQAGSDAEVLVELGRLIAETLGESAEWASDAAPALLDFLGEIFSAIDF